MNMAAAGISGVVIAVSPRRSCASVLTPSEGNYRAPSSQQWVSHFFGQRCGVSPILSALRRTKNSAASGTSIAYAMDSEYIRDNFISGGSSSTGEIICNNLYDCLRVSKLATPEQIKAAYRSKALQVHPDVVPKYQREEATKVFRDLQVAYDTLSDSQARATYDLKLRMRDTGPVSTKPSQWGFISVPSDPDNPSSSVTFRGRKNYESDFFT